MLPVAVGLLCIVGSFAAPKPHFGFGFGMFHKGGPPCGLPPFIEDLPADAKTKVEEIWKDYKEGNKCFIEHAKTKEVIDSLPDDVRKGFFKSHVPLPPPLRKAPKDIQEKFIAIWKDKSISFEDKPQKAYELAQKVLTGDLLAEFNKMHEKMTAFRKEREAKIAKLSPEAKTAFDKLEALKKQKFEIWSDLSESVRDELLEVGPRFPFPPPHRH